MLLIGAVPAACLTADQVQAGPLHPSSRPAGIFRRPSREPSVTKYCSTCSGLIDGDAFGNPSHAA
jgi:hypothetical protein